jgi:hypothetical protein
MDWETWVKKGGLPPVQANFTTANMTEAIDMAKKYIQLNGTDHPTTYKDYLDWYSSLKVVFLEQLVESIDEVSLAIITKIDTDLNVSSSLDPEIKQRWYPLGIRKKYAPVKDLAFNFISSMGRMKYLKPIY